MQQVLVRETGEKPLVERRGARQRRPGRVPEPHVIQPARAKAMAQARPISPAPMTAMTAMTVPPGSSGAESVRDCRNAKPVGVGRWTERGGGLFRASATLAAEGLSDEQRDQRNADQRGRQAGRVP